MDMALSAKNVRAQLNRLTPLMENRSLETIRKGQNALGSLMSSGLRREIIVKKHDFRIHRQSSCNGNSLLLTARKLIRV